MSIQLEFINFVVPIKVIEDKYPGGWQRCLIKHKKLIGGRIWYDEFLFRDGAMGPEGIEHLFNKWTEMGFTPTETIDGKSHWKDVCIIEGMLGGLTRPCEWLIYDAAAQSVSMRGDTSKVVVSRYDFKEEPGWVAD